MPNIFITGVPRSGKTTLIKRVLDSLNGDKKGFITREVREEGQRTGFEIITSTGEKTLLAGINIKSHIKVSRYFIDILGFEGLLSPLYNIRKELLYIDEIGQMELYSNRFQGLVRLYLDSSNLFLGTISKVYEHPLIREIRKRRDVTLFDLTSENREEIFRKVHTLISEYRR